jgi:hypothetical protein
MPEERSIEEALEKEQEDVEENVAHQAGQG